MSTVPDPDDLAAVQADDELLDRVSHGDVRDDDDEAAHLLAQWAEDGR